MSRNHIIYQRPDDSGVVIVGEQGLADGGQQPEGLLLGAVDQQHRCHDVHGLAVADLRVAERVRAQHSAQR